MDKGVLIKSVMEVLEDLHKEHKRNHEKLLYLMNDIELDLKRNGHTIPLSSFVKQADYFDEARFSDLRKRLLDRVNDFFRTENL